MSASRCLHVLAVHGLDAEFEHEEFTSGRDLLRLFTDDECGKAYFGAPAMVRTRYGVRPAMHGEFGKSQESHYDQTLGCMAQLGVPLSLHIHIKNELCTLRDVLRDSIACFELRQDEIEWTAIAYASYLPPHREWANKFGDQYSFDELTEEVLRREFREGSCCGCHIVEAMITLLRVDGEEAQLLSSEVRRRLAKRLGDVVAAVVSRQHANGSWGPDWHQDLAGPSTTEGPSPDARSLALRLVATSHIAHWMMYLPDERRVPADILRRAGTWLHRQLRDVNREFVRENFCPCCHGASVLRALCCEAGNRRIERVSMPSPEGDPLDK